MKANSAHFARRREGGHMKGAAPADKELGEQLLVDAARYASHQDCKVLVCFVYDPDGFVVNPDGLVSDLELLQGNVEVRVFIEPR